jgi:hypothetical protein
MNEQSLRTLRTLGTKTKHILGAVESMTANYEILTESNANALSALTTELEDYDLRIREILNEVVVPQNN